MRVKLYMTDNFSGAKNTKEINVNEASLKSIEKSIKNKTVINQFKDQINWNWVINKVVKL